MLHFSKWKAFGILLAVLISIVMALPNVLPASYQAMLKPYGLRPMTLGLDLQLVVVDHLDHAADEAALGHHRVALADLLQHLLVFLHLALLRADEQEVEHAHDQDEGQDHADEIARTGGSAGGLGKGRSDEQGISPERKFGRNIAMVASIATNRLVLLYGPFPLG